jgi:hypothetical protein
MASTGVLHCPHPDCSFSDENRQKVIEHRYFMHDESPHAHIRRRAARLANRKMR